MVNFTFTVAFIILHPFSSIGFPKLQYFGHLMWRTDSFEKTLILGKIEGGRRRGRQRMRRLNGINDSTDMSLSELRKLLMDMPAAVHGVAKNQTWVSDWTEPHWNFICHKTCIHTWGKENFLTCTFWNKLLIILNKLSYILRVSKIIKWLRTYALKLNRLEVKFRCYRLQLTISVSQRVPKCLQPCSIICKTGPFMLRIKLQYM